MIRKLIFWLALTVSFSTHPACIYASGPVDRTRDPPLHSVIAQALEGPSANIYPPTLLVLLQALKSDRKECRSFHRYFRQKIEREVQRSGSVDNLASFLNYHFREFALENRSAANAIIYRIILPRNRILCKAAYHFSIELYLDGLSSWHDRSLDLFITQDCIQVFKNEFEDLISERHSCLTPMASPQERFFSLLSRFEKTFSPASPKIKYICAFLEQLGYEKIFDHFIGCPSDMEHLPQHGAVNFLLQLAFVSQEEIEGRDVIEMLQAILPAYSGDITSKSFSWIIILYAESGLEPVRLPLLPAAHPANPRNVHRFVAKTLDGPAVFLPRAQKYLLLSFAADDEHTRELHAFFNARLPLSLPPDCASEEELAVERLETCFRKYVKKQPIMASDVLLQAVLPHYPVLAGYPFDHRGYLNGSKNIGDFIEHSAVKVFKKELLRLLSPSAPAGTASQDTESSSEGALREHAYLDLLQRYEQTFSEQARPLQYYCAFLEHLGLEPVHAAFSLGKLDPLGKSSTSVGETLLMDLARICYYEMPNREIAAEALKRVLPASNVNTRRLSLEAAMSIYVRSGEPPMRRHQEA